MRRIRKATAASDFGHSISLSTRVSPAVAHAISILVASDRWDFENVAGFLRAAALVLLERCEVEEPGIGEWHYVELIEERIRIKHEQLRFRDIIDGLRDQLDAMADAGEWDDLQKHLENIMSTIYNMEDGSRKETYRNYMKEFELRLVGFGKVNGHRQEAIPGGADDTSATGATREPGVEIA